MRGMASSYGGVFLFVLTFTAVVCGPRVYAQTDSDGQADNQSSEAIEEAYPKRELLFFEEIRFEEEVLMGC